MVPGGITIADIIKYIDFLKKRENMLAQKVREVEKVKKVTRIIGKNGDDTFEEVETPTIDAKSLTEEYDKNAKELRLAQQALEKANHTTYIDFNTQY